MGLTLLPLAVLVWVLALSPFLAVDRVTVQGTDRLTSDQVRQVADVPVGGSMLRLDATAVRDRVAALPPVAQVDIARAWPGTVRVRVVERRPAVAVRGPDRQWQLVDSTGVAYAQVADLPPGLPRLQVATPGPAADDPSTTAALQVVQELPDDLRGLVAQVQADAPGPGTVRLGLVDGRTVTWGAPGDAGRKGAAVLALLGRPGRVIDVSTPSVAVVSQ